MLYLPKLLKRCFKSGRRERRDEFSVEFVLEVRESSDEFVQESIFRGQALANSLRVDAGIISMRRTSGWYVRVLQIYVFHIVHLEDGLE